MSGRAESAPEASAGTIRRATVALVLGDQLTLRNPALATLDRSRDTVLMIEAPGEATHVRSHKARIALFLSAMRHFAATLTDAGYRLRYVDLEEPGPSSLPERLARTLTSLGAGTLVVCEPGEWRLDAAIRQVCGRAGIALRVLPDPHFLASREAFSQWAGNARSLRMEFFYRFMRRQTGILMRDGQPEHGRWNFDQENRAGLGRRGPGAVPSPPRFAPDTVTLEVLSLVERRFTDHPGELAAFAWPVTREQALAALRDFVEHRLRDFGRHQDAMWSGEPFLWHSLLASSLNLKLLDPGEVIETALEAYRRNALPIASVEGFIRQILGWREFIRGVYWRCMPELARANHYGHRRPLPGWYWTGATHMRCMSAAIGQTLAHGYAHHIQRLMLTGNFALLAEIDPGQVHEWYLAVYVDAVEWVELPNTLGMALFADGGGFTSKPYAASGAYVRRMSNYCDGCRYRPAQRTGSAACPLTTLYWRFLDRHEETLAANPRTALMARNVARLTAAERADIRQEGDRMLASIEAI
jgi:deoxyribodipyrimidine photolyase-related protein